MTTPPEPFPNAVFKSESILPLQESFILPSFIQYSTLSQAYVNDAQYALHSTSTSLCSVLNAKWTLPDSSVTMTTLVLGTRLKLTYYELVW